MATQGNDSDKKGPSKDQLDLTLGMVAAMKDLAAQGALVEESFQSQAESMMAICEAMKCLESSAAVTQLQNVNNALKQITGSVSQLESSSKAIKGLADSATGAANQTKNLGTQTGLTDKKLKDLTANIEKSSKSASGLGKVFKSGLGIAAATAGGAISGLIGGFRTLFNVGKSIFSFAGGVVKAFGKIGMSIISIPFKMLDALTDMADNVSGAISELAQSANDLRQEFGSLSGPINSSIIKTAKSMEGLALSGTKVFSVFGNVAERQKLLMELYKGGSNIRSFSDEIEDGNGAILGFQRGLGLTIEDMNSLAGRAKIAGEPLTKSLLRITNLADKMGKEFKLESKVISRALGAASKDMLHFGHLSETQLTASVVYAEKLGTSLDKIAGAMDKFSTFDDAAENVARLNEAFNANIDLGEVMKETDVTKQYEIIRKGLMRAGVQGENLLPTEKRLLEAHAGMTAEMAGLALSRNNAGISLDKLSKKSKEASKTTITQADAMIKLSDAMERTLKATDPPGGKGFFGKFINGITDGIQRTPAFVGLMFNLKASLLDVATAGRRVGTSFVDNFPGVKDMLGGLTDLFKPATFKKLTNGVVGVFTQFFKDLETGKASFPDLMDRLKKYFFNFLDAEAPGAKKFISGFGKFTLTLTKVFAQMGEWAMNKLTGLITSITEFITNPTAAIAKAKNLAGSAAAAGKGYVSPLTEAFSRAGPPLWEALSKLFSTLWNKLKPILLDLGKKAEKYIKGFLLTRMLMGGLLSGLGAGVGLVGKKIAERRLFSVLRETGRGGASAASAASAAGTAGAAGTTTAKIRKAAPVAKVWNRPTAGAFTPISMDRVKKLRVRTTSRHAAEQMPVPNPNAAGGNARTRRTARRAAAREAPVATPSQQLADGSKKRVKSMSREKAFKGPQGRSITPGQSIRKIKIKTPIPAAGIADVGKAAETAKNVGKVGKVGKGIKGVAGVAGKLPSVPSPSPKDITSLTMMSKLKVNFIAVMTFMAGFALFMVLAVVTFGLIIKVIKATGATLAQIAGAMLVMVGISAAAALTAYALQAILKAPKVDKGKLQRFFVTMGLVMVAGIGMMYLLIKFVQSNPVSPTEMLTIAELVGIMVVVFLAAAGIAVIGAYVGKMNKDPASLIAGMLAIGAVVVAMGIAAVIMVKALQGSDPAALKSIGIILLAISSMFITAAVVALIAVGVGLGIMSSGGLAVAPMLIGLAAIASVVVGMAGTAYDILDSLNKLKVNPADITQKAEAFSKVMDSVTNLTKEVGSILNTLRKITDWEDNPGELIDKVTLFIKELMIGADGKGGIQGVIQTMINGIKEIPNDKIPTIVAFGSLVGSLGTAIGSIGHVAESFTKSVEGGWTNLFRSSETITGEINEVLKTGSKFIEDVLKSSHTFIESLIKSVSKYSSHDLEAIKAVGPSLGGILSGMGELIKNLMPDISAFKKNVTRTVSVGRVSKEEEAPEQKSIEQVFDAGAMTMVKDYIVGLVGALASIMPGLIDAIAKAMNLAAKGITTPEQLRSIEVMVTLMKGVMDMMVAVAGIKMPNLKSISVAAGSSAEIKQTINVQATNFARSLNDIATGMPHIIDMLIAAAKKVSGIQGIDKQIETLIKFMGILPPILSVISALDEAVAKTSDVASDKGGASAAPKKLNSTRMIEQMTSITTFFESLFGGESPQILKLVGIINKSPVKEIEEAYPKLKGLGDLFFGLKRLITNIQEIISAVTKTATPAEGEAPPPAATASLFQPMIDAITQLNTALSTISTSGAITQIIATLNVIGAIVVPEAKLTALTNLFGGIGRLVSVLSSGDLLTKHVLPVGRVILLENLSEINFLLYDMWQHNWRNGGANGPNAIGTIGGIQKALNDIEWKSSADGTQAITNFAADFSSAGDALHKLHDTRVADSDDILKDMVALDKTLVNMMKPDKEGSIFNIQKALEGVKWNPDPAKIVAITNFGNDMKTLGAAFAVMESLHVDDGWVHDNEFLKKLVVLNKAVFGITVRNYYAASEGNYGTMKFMTEDLSPAKYTSMPAQIAAIEAFVKDMIPLSAAINTLEGIKIESSVGITGDTKIDFLKNLYKLNKSIYGITTDNSYGDAGAAGTMKSISDALDTISYVPSPVRLGMLTMFASDMTTLGDKIGEISRIAFEQGTDSTTLSKMSMLHWAIYRMWEDNNMGEKHKKGAGENGTIGGIQNSLAQISWNPAAGKEAIAAFATDMASIGTAINGLITAVNALPDLSSGTQDTLLLKLGNLNGFVKKLVDPVNFEKMTEATKQQITPTIAAIDEMISAAQRLHTAISAGRLIDISAALKPFTAETFGANGAYTIKAQDVVINVSFSVTMNAGDVEKAMLTDKSSIRSKINTIIAAVKTTGLDGAAKKANDISPL